MSGRARAVGLVAALVCAGGCTSLLGIVEPNVVGDDAGSDGEADVRSEADASDAAIDGAADSRADSGSAHDAEGGEEACANGAACTPANACHAGKLDCSTATPVCKDTGANAANGTSCGTNEVCDNGSCNACTAGVSCTPTNPCHVGSTSCSTGVSVCTDTGNNVANGTSCGGGTCSSGSCVAGPPSCAPGGAGMTNCGSGSASCCASLEVVGGTYDRSYDGFTYTSTSSPATVSGFRLDQYEITVGRLRQYVNYLAAAGSLPAAGSGKHTHLNGGQGLAATGGGYETGWDATNWNSQIATTAAGWNSNLSGGTWTASAGSNEKLAVTEIDWYEAYAFCIWDGGFLPSESEWNYAASGGSDQRAYPWSPAYPPGSTTISCSDANYSGCAAGAVNAVGSESPAGDGKWGQSDLAGNVWEWTLDWYASSYVTPCTDCANLTAASYRVVRGGSFDSGTSSLLASYRNYYPPTLRYANVGARCSRTP